MSEYTEFFLNNSGSVVELECLEITHPSFTKAYRIVRNASDGVTVTHENATTHFYQYYPVKIKSSGERGDLDQGVQILLGDLSEVLPPEIDAVTDADDFATKPVVKYRTYRSDNLTTVMFGPLILEVVTFSFTRQASTFEARAPQLNINKTGELYKIERFPMLRGLL